MSTLADELLQDFEDSGSEEGNEQQNGPALLDGGGVARSSLAHTNGDRAMEDADEVYVKDEDFEMVGVEGSDVKAIDDPEEAKAKVEKMKLGGVQDVHSVATLMRTLRPVLDEIAKYQKTPVSSTDVGNIESNPEYALLTQANQLSTMIDSEVMLVNKWIRDHNTLFPELETLITNPLDYAKVAAILGQGPLEPEMIKKLETSADNPLGVTLKSVLDGPTFMIVTVEATTSRGRPMSEAEFGLVYQACLLQIELDKAKRIITEYVTSRMEVFAPNLTALIGSLTSAQLLATAGGLKNLSIAPACNLPAWGSKKQANAALATNVGFRQQGFIYQSPVLRGISSDYKKQAMKKFANKIVICARMDCSLQFRDGSEGERLKDETLDNIEKLQQKPLNKGGRALPVPDDKPSRKRGGRRARKAKEALAMTDLRKQQNRMAFGKEEQEVGYGAGDSTKGLGMMGQQDGRLRTAQIDQRTRAKLSAKSKGWGGASSLVSGGASSLKGLAGAGGMGNISLAASKGLRTSGVGTSLNSTAGTVSSLAFTPMQGLELVDPELQSKLKRKRQEEEDRYFKGGTFTQLTAPSQSAKDDGVFKKPELPASKRVNTGTGR